MKTNNKKTVNTRLNAIADWFNFKKKMFHLWWADAPKYQRDIEKGNYYIRRGAIYQVGQPFHFTPRGKKIPVKMYINN